MGSVLGRLRRLMVLATKQGLGIVLLLVSVKEKEWPELNRLLREMPEGWEIEVREMVKRGRRKR